MSAGAPKSSAHIRPLPPPDGVFWNVLSFGRRAAITCTCRRLPSGADVAIGRLCSKRRRPHAWADVADEEDTTNLVTLVRLQDIVRSAHAAPAPTAGTDFVVPPVRQSYKQRISGCRRAPEDAGRV